MNNDLFNAMIAAGLIPYFVNKGFKKLPIDRLRLMVHDKTSECIGYVLLTEDKAMVFAEYDFAEVVWQATR